MLDLAFDEMEDRSSRRMRTLATQMAVRDLSANEIAGALIPMVDRSTTGSNQRPDTLLQDRRSTRPAGTASRTFGSKAPLLDVAG
jgi:hypothetical protein